MGFASADPRALQLYRSLREKKIVNKERKIAIFCQFFTSLKFLNHLNKLENAIFAPFPSNEAWISRWIEQQVSYELPELSIALSWRKEQDLFELISSFRRRSQKLDKEPNKQIILSCIHSEAKR